MDKGTKSLRSHRHPPVLFMEMDVFSPLCPCETGKQEHNLENRNPGRSHDQYLSAVADQSSGDEK